MIAIGTFRFGAGRYETYIAYSRDCSGLSYKSEVKIAGMRVGFLDALELDTSGQNPVKMTLLVSKEYPLYQDARVAIRQDGLLGAKYLEISPGTSSQLRLPSGSTLASSVSSESLDEIYAQCKRITTQVEEITIALNGLLNDQQSGLVNDLRTAGKHIALSAQTVDALLQRNEAQIDAFLSAGTHIKAAAEMLHNDMLPTLTQRISYGLDKVESIVDKVNDGKGTIGKLLNEDQAYRDIATVASGLRGYLDKVDSLQMVFDNHVESMHRPADDYQFDDVKGFFGIRIHPSSSYFYLLQLVTSERGYVQRDGLQPTYFTEGNSTELAEYNAYDIKPLLKNHPTAYDRNSLRMSLQFGKIFNRSALRFGIFENTVGLGLDIDIPVHRSIRWVTSFEAYEFTGWNHRDDRRPHLKWLNRMFFMRNLYVTVGADDFISKKHSTLFIGGGLRLSDDDFKSLFASVTGTVIA